MKVKAILSALLTCAVLCGCSNTDVQPSGLITEPEKITSEASLICLAESREEAESIAAQYNIHLVDFSYGVATFRTDEDPNEVIRNGLAKGWPELSLNQIIDVD